MERPTQKQCIKALNLPVKINGYTNARDKHASAKTLTLQLITIDVAPALFTLNPSTCMRCSSKVGIKYDVSLKGIILKPIFLNSKMDL